MEAAWIITVRFKKKILHRDPRSGGNDFPFTLSHTVIQTAITLS
jgi:hypothetical protein